VGTLFLAQALPRLLGPFGGALSDRTDLRRLMVACDIAGAIVFGLLALLPPFAIIVLLAAAGTALQAPYSPARTTFIAALVAQDETSTAYAIENTAFNLQVAIGPVIGGLLFAAFGASTALAIDAASFLVSALLISRVPFERAVVVERTGIWREVRDGMRFAFGDPVIRMLTITFFMTIGFFALADVALPFLIRETLGGGPAAYGFATGAFGVGMLTASLTLAFRPGSSPSRVYLTGVTTSGVGALVTGASPSLGAAIAFQGAAGVGNGIENVASTTLTQRHVPPEMLGRVFGMLATAAYGGQAIASFLGGFYLDLTSPRTVMVTAGVGALLALALAIGPLTRAHRHA
jgi:MFS family permease